MAVGPLNGIRVLDFSHVLAGPFCTRLLADLGADVVRIETGLRPDRLGAGTWKKGMENSGGRPAAYLNTNRSKRGIAINLKRSGGLLMARRLVAKADVVVENFSAGVMDRLQLGYEDLSKLNPRIVFVRMAGFGQLGPRRGWTSMNMNLQACSGLMLATGEEGEAPIAVSNSWNDYIGGLHAAFATIEALAERANSGKGRQVDLSQFECSVSSIGGLVLQSHAEGRSPPRTGNRSALHFPHDVFRCAGDDNWCALCIKTDEEWKRLVYVLKSAVLSTLADCDVAQRRKHGQTIYHEIATFFRRHSSREIEGLLLASGLRAQAVSVIEDVVARISSDGGVFAPIDDPRVGSMLSTGLPFQFSQSGIAAMRPAPELGEHTAEVLQEWIGVKPEAFDALLASGDMT